MNEHADQLRSAFESHEHLAPDTGTVYDRVQELAKTYRRRRRGVQAAGGAVLGAGLIAGGLAVPRGSHQVVVVQSPASALASTSTPSPAPTGAELQKDINAFIAAGYTYWDSETLAKIWGLGIDEVSAKAEGGRRLLAGQTLPIKPGSTPVPPGSNQTPQEVLDVAAFFAAGYNYQDAQTLAKLWHTPDPYHAKIKGGRELRLGKKLPIVP